MSFYNIWVSKIRSLTIGVSVNQETAYMCLWVCKLIRPLWKTSYYFVTLDIFIHYTPAILPGIYPLLSMHACAQMLSYVQLFSYSRESSQPRDRTLISCISRQILCCWAIREAPTPRYILLIPQQESDTRMFIVAICIRKTMTNNLLHAKEW